MKSKDVMNIIEKEIHIEKRIQEITERLRRAIREEKKKEMNIYPDIERGDTGLWELYLKL